MNVSVSRTPLRLLTYALLAVPAILLAVDMTISYRWIRAPETTEVVVGQVSDEAGVLIDTTKDVLTDTGRAERRRDLLFGGALLVGGVAAMGWAIKELASPTRFLIADDEGLLIRVDGFRRPPRRFAWSGIAELRSEVIEDDGVPSPVLSIRLSDIEEVPHLLAGGLSDPPWFYLFAEEWDKPAHMVASLIEHQVAKGRSVEEPE